MAELLLIVSLLAVFVFDILDLCFMGRLNS